jgi:hypothetical protein
MRQLYGLIRRIAGRRSMLTGIAALLLVPVIQVATAGADAITFNENSTTVPSKPRRDPPAHDGTAAGCPNSHPHLTGGGAALSRVVDPDIQLWATDVIEEPLWGGIASNVDTGHNAELTVTALCAKRGNFSYPEAEKDGDPGVQVAKGVNCPPGKKLTGGGVVGTTIDLSQKRRGGIPAPEVAATYPEDGPDENSKRDDRWVGAIGRGNIIVDAVCAKKAGTFKYVHSAREDVPSGVSAGSATARCPVGTEVTGGGADITGINPGIKMVVSAPDASGEHQIWSAFATNSTGEDQEIQAFAICKV